MGKIKIKLVNIIGQKRDVPNTVKREETLKRKRDRERERRKIKNNPEMYAEFKIK